MTVRHTQMTVETAQGLSDRELVDWFDDDPEEIRKYIAELKEKGQLFFHTEGCTNFDPATHKCLGCDPVLSDIEVKAEVYKVIRANQDMPVKSILNKVKEHLPDVSVDRIRAAIGELL